jgi:hypothetical protein
MYTSTQREKPAGISSGSIDALRVQLMKMNSQQLQAFATANQDDAIKLGLVAEADKYKKQHGQEAMALMSGQQAQPPVAQQILQGIGQPPQQPMPPQGQGMPPQQMAQGQMPPQGMANGGYMLPEDQGIATLPSGNMDFADGGIVAFDAGGSTTSPVGRFFSDLTTQTQTPEQKQRAALQQTLIRKRAELSEQGGIFGLKQQTPQQKEIYNRTKAEIDYLENLVRNPNYTPAAATSAAPPATAAAPAAAINPYDPATAIRRSDFTNEPYPAALPPALPKPAVEPGLPAIAATKFQRTTVPDIDVKKQLELYEQSMPKDIVDPLAEQRREANAPAIQAAARQVSLFEQEVQNRKPAFEDRLKALDKKEARVNTMEDRNLNMSLLEAGLSMMSGDSPHAFVNIGKGAQVGIKSYAEGQAKVEAARDKMEEARARIDEFRRNEDMMTAKERRAVLRDYDNTLASAARDMLGGVEKMYGIKRAEITTAIADKNARDTAKMQIQSSENMGIAGLESQRNIAMANMQNQRNIAAMPSATERILSNPELFGKQMELQTAATGMRGDTAYRETWAKSPYLQTQYPNINDYLRAMGVQPTVNLPANAPNVLP